MIGKSRKAVAGLLGIAVLAGAAGLAFATDAPKATAYLAFGQIYALPVGQDGPTTHIQHNAYVYDMLLSADASLLYIADSAGVHVMSTATSRTVKELVTTPAFSMHLSASRLYVVTQAASGEITNRTVSVIDLASGHVVRDFNVPKLAGSVVVSPDETKIAVLDLTWNTVGVYSATGELLKSLNMFKVTDAADAVSSRERKHDRLAPLTKGLITPDSKTLYVVEVGGAKNATTVWGIDLATFATTWIDLGHQANVRGAALSPDAHFLYLNCVQHVSKIDLAQKREVLWVKSTSTYYNQAMTLSADGGTLYVCGSNVENLEDGTARSEGKFFEIGAEDLRVQRSRTIDGFSPVTLAVARN